MRTSTLSAPAFALARFASAANNSMPAYPYYNDYPSTPYPGSAPHASPQVFINANNNPNASNTVAFQHQPFSSNTTVTANWTWTVKVSDVVIPINSSRSYLNASETHVAYTTYDFTWPEDGNLDEALYYENRADRATPVTSCAYLFFAQFPANVSKLFEEGGGSNCTGILGAECVKNLTALYSTRDCSTSSFQTSSPAFEAACGGTFGAALGGGWGVGGYYFGNSSAGANSTNDGSLGKSDTYAYSLSAAYSPENLTVYNQAKDNVHVLMLRGATTELLCNRAGNGSSLTSAAVGRSGVGLGVVGVVAVLAGLFSVL